MIVVMIVIVAPTPVFLLLVAVQLAKVVAVAMRLGGPLLVVDIFVVIPAVIVAVVRVVDSIGAICAPGSDGRREKSGGQQQRTQISGYSTNNARSSSFLPCPR